jgi:hypothetical protein
MTVEKLLKNIRCFIFGRRKKTSNKTRKKRAGRDVFTVRREDGSVQFVWKIIYGFCSAEWWWEQKNSFKCKNRKITFLVLLTEHIYCIFVCHNFSLSNEIWCLNVCSISLLSTPYQNFSLLFFFLAFPCFLRHHLSVMSCRIASIAVRKKVSLGFQFGVWRRWQKLPVGLGSVSSMECWRVGF